MYANQTSGIGAGSQLAAAPSEIQSGMNDIEGQISLALDRLSALHTALGTVMTPAVPQDCKVGISAVQSVPSTPLGQALDEHNARLRSINNSLLDLLNRIQL